MKNKNTVTILLTIFALICAFNLFQTYRRFSREAEAERTGTEQELLTDTAGYLNLQPYTFSLGLDLKGGLFVMLEVGLEELLEQYAGSAQDQYFKQALDRAVKKKVESQASLIDLFAQELKTVYREQNIPNQKGLLAKYFVNPDLGIQVQTPDERVIEILKENAKNSIDVAYNIINTRIDRFGVASPEISLDDRTGRIVLQLPGVKDPERVEKLLQTTAKLEFRETVSAKESNKILEEINQVAREIAGISSDTTQVKNTAIAPEDEAVVETDGPSETVAAVEGEEASDEQATTQEGSVEEANPFETTVGATTDNNDTGAEVDTASFATKEDLQEKFYSENPILGPLERSANMAAGGALAGIIKMSDTAAFNKYLNHPEIVEILDLNQIRFFYGANPSERKAGYIDLYAINYPEEVQVTGDMITDARQDFKPQSTEPIVTISMDETGRERWSKMTEKNKGRQIAIILDNVVYSAPNVENRITQGRTEISGSFDIQEAKDLATVLSAGSLPVKIKKLGSTEIGPSLGAENLQKGLFSFLIAFLATIVFMLFYYNSAGMIANVALIANLFFILGVSAGFNIVFTLPGIAAVVLTMGMAIDANVLIFERIREEQLLGKSFKASITSGFRNAFSSVMDANITTFLTGVVLFAFGTGPIRGFAVNLMIGIITSLISALFITRLILEYFANKGRENIRFGNQKTLKAFKNINLNMPKRRKAFYVVSGLLVAASLVSFFTVGFQAGVDLKGGRLYTVDFAQEVSPAQIKQELTEAFGGEEPVIRSVSGSNQLLITTSFKVNEPEASNEVDSLLLGAFASTVPNAGAEIIGTQNVGPTIAEQIRRSAIYSVIFSLLIIFTYILIRFRRYEFSLGALAALFHDVIIVLGVFSLFGYLDILPFSLEIDQTIIAALLTIVGYSINDTVVVFDRIRENKLQMKTAKTFEIYNVSINQTISRTLITSFTTLLTILVLFFFGGESIRGFMFALFVGIIVGTYSSIFVASPISMDLYGAEEDK